jgi:hypothetical protein
VTRATLGVMSSADVLLVLQLGIPLLAALAVAVGRDGVEEDGRDGVGR